MNDNNAQKYMDTVTQEGKIISVNLEIINSSKAKDLLATMYDKNFDTLGVKVHSWGFWDILKANKIRMHLINEENSRHQTEISSIMCLRDLDLLEHYSEFEKYEA